jgi:predicted SAM-dependent methyltransferase
MVRINLGSDKSLTGYVNIPFGKELPESNVILCEELHKVERKDTIKVLKKCFKSLVNNGKLSLVLPDFSSFLDDYKNDKTENGEANGYDNALELFRKRLFDNGARSIFTPTPARNMVINAGFTITAMIRREGNICIEAERRDC